MAQVQTKKYKCYKCNIEITFKSGQYNKNGKAKLFNLDGTEHFCQEQDKNNYKNSEEYQQNNEQRNKQRNNRYWRYFWSHGTGANYKKYSNDEYKNRRKESRQKREEYKQKYYNESMTQDKALEILELTRDILQKSKAEILQAVKLAYRKLALRFHPDRNKTPEASQKFIEATEAFEYMEQIIK